MEFCQSFRHVFYALTKLVVPNISFLFSGKQFSNLCSMEKCWHCYNIHIVLFSFFINIRLCLTDWPQCKTIKSDLVYLLTISSLLNPTNSHFMTKTLFSVSIQFAIGRFTQNENTNGVFTVFVYVMDRHFR